METFGEYMRRLREHDGMPLRKLAAILDIDQSTLSKIERNDRRPTRKMVPALAKTFNVDKRQMMIRFLSDVITYELAGEESGLDALKAAEQNIAYKIKSAKD